MELLPNPTFVVAGGGLRHGCNSAPVMAYGTVVTALLSQPSSTQILECGWEIRKHGKCGSFVRTCSFADITRTTMLVQYRACVQYSVSCARVLFTYITKLVVKVPCGAFCINKLGKPSTCDDVIKRAHVSRSSRLPHREGTDGLRRPPF